MALQIGKFIFITRFIYYYGSSSPGEKISVGLEFLKDFGAVESSTQMSTNSPMSLTGKCISVNIYDAKEEDFFSFTLKIAWKP